MSNSFPSSIPPKEQPAHRLAEGSATYLSDTELLSLVLARNLPVPRSLEIARRLLSHAGSVRRLARMTYAELAKIDGLGPASACTVQAAFGLASRLMMPERQSRPKLESPLEVANLMRGQFLNLEREEFHTLLLDTTHWLVRDELVTMGLLAPDPRQGKRGSPCTPHGMETGSGTCIGATRCKFPTHCAFLPEGSRGNHFPWRVWAAPKNTTNQPTEEDLS